MSASKLIHNFSSHPAAFWFWDSSPSDNITLNAANENTDQEPHAFLDTEHLICHTRNVLVNTIASLQGSDGEIIQVSVVHGPFNKIHDLLNNTLSKWAGKSSCILA